MSVPVTPLGAPGSCLAFKTGEAAKFLTYDNGRSPTHEKQLDAGGSWALLSLSINLLAGLKDNFSRAAPGIALATARKRLYLYGLPGRRLTWKRPVMNGRATGRLSTLRQEL